ncbi:MAG: hypothetical protein LBU65_03325 [Planctomycetaceae bacterium]|nr:hypothetical protein [Planctomycetaceae bacterium]
MPYFIERVNISGAIDIDTLETVVAFAGSVNAQLTIRLLEKLIEIHFCRRTRRTLTC